MNRRTRRGFTLIELLVVITIIGMLMALLMPAVQSARETARAAQCRNRQRQLGSALQQYEATYQYFPGYVDQIGKNASGSPIITTWVVPLFPYLGENDLWNKWREGEQRKVYRKLFTCPSDPPEQTSAGATPLAYVVNCGRRDIRGATPPDNKSNGVFHDRRDKGGVRVSLGYIHQNDGAQKTLLLSETVRPQTPSTAQPHTWSQITSSDINKIEASLGFTWATQSYYQYKINEKILEDLPRPASHHGGGVIATFCDGHVVFLREDIDYYVYVHLMTPNSIKSGYPFQTGQDVFDGADL